MLDLAIIGSGPAALTAALYVARAGFKVEVFEKAKIGGALTEIAKLENYPGFVGTGDEFIDTLKKQCKDAGVTIIYGECTSVNPLIIDEEAVSARAVLIATGSEPKTLDFDAKKPVSYCALCDGSLYQGKNVAVIGGGNSAISGAIYLASIANQVTVLTRSKLKATDCIIKKATEFSNIKICEQTKVNADALAAYDGIFVFIGKRPATTFMSAKTLDKDGYIKTNNYMSKLKGVFAAGDVRADSIKQVVTASADGAAAAIAIMDYLNHD